MTPEHRAMNDIRAWLGERGIPCFRANVGTVMTADGKAFSTGLPEGFPDLFALAGGTVLFIEVKSRKGRLREAQRAFRAEMGRLGYPYIVARSAADVEEALKKHEINI